jgi:membrane-associated phospholipid phosphatase
MNPTCPEYSATNRSPKALLAWLGSHRVGLVLLFAGVLGPLYLFGILAEEIIERENFAIDRAILLWVRAHSSPELDQLMLLASFLGSAYVTAPINLAVIALLAGRKRRTDAVFWLLAWGGAALLNFLAKLGFQRIRPDLWHSIAPESTFSFPSGHAMQSMALAAALVVLTWGTRWRKPALAFAAGYALLVGCSRVYLGVHFPTDILAGWSASLAWVTGLSLVLHGHMTRKHRHTFPGGNS